MLIEKIMNRFDRTALQWRGMGPLKYLPFLVCYVLVPVTIYILQSAGTTYHLLDTMWNQIALIYPIMAAWWTALCVEPVMGQEGELFGLYERNKWVDVLIYFVLYDIMIVPVCLWIMNRWPDYIYPEDFIGLFIQCFFSACPFFPYMTICFSSLSSCVYSCLIFFCKRRTTGQVASIISILLRLAVI